MRELKTAKLCLRPFSEADFDTFVAEMLTDPRVIEFYHSYTDPGDSESLRAKAETDFWHQFEVSRAEPGYEIWALFERSSSGHADTPMVGWVGLIHTDLCIEHGGPELQYMLASEVHGKGYATEAAREVLRDAEERGLTRKVIAVVDMPNASSIRVLEKLGFQRRGQINAYGSSEMYLYSRRLET